MAAVLAAAILFGAACTSEAEAVSYDSARDVAQALQEAGSGCDDIQEVMLEEDAVARSSATCTLGDAEVTLFTFDSEDQRDEWLSVAENFEDPIVVGENWSAIAPDDAAAEVVAESAGGEVQ